MNAIQEKFRDVTLSVIPIVAIVLFLHFTFAPMNPSLIYRFLLGSLFVIIGLAIFLLGVDIGVTPLGELTGSFLAKTNKVWIVLLGGFILGFFISIAEPGLMVLANQVDMVTGSQISSMAILVVVSIGLALLLSLGFFRILYDIPLYKMLFVIYGIIGILMIFVSPEFLAISFDASGATTGILAVPFILSLSAGISKLKKDSVGGDSDSFGLVALASSGAILALLILDIIKQTDGFQAFLDVDVDSSLSMWKHFSSLFSPVMKESLLALLPIVVIFLVLHKISFKLRANEFRKLVTGFILSLIGLLFFLLGVNGGFMDVGTSLGQNLVQMENKAYIIITSFILGVVTILAEPAVHVLTHQIEEVTSGYIRRKLVLIPLALGVGLAVMLSMIRILVPGVALWHYLLVGYIICLGLTLIVPDLFVGIAFDAGGVATGPVTATFILAFVQGAANAYEGADLMIDGFGMIAMVAMMPIITLQMLGFVFKLKTKGGKKNVN